LGFGVWFWGMGFGVWGLGIWVLGLGFGVCCFGFGVWGLRVWNVGVGFGASKADWSLADDPMCRGKIEVEMSKDTSWGMRFEGEGLLES